MTVSSQFTDQASVLRGEAPISIARRVGPQIEPSPASQGFGSEFSAEAFKTVSTTTLRTGQIVAARVTGGAAAGLSASFAPEKSYLVILHLLDCAGGELWKSGRSWSTTPFMAGSLIIAHMQDNPALLLRDNFDFIALKIPEIVLDELADGSGAARVSELRSEGRAHDAVLHHLARAMACAVERAQDGDVHFFEYMSRAICQRLAQSYGVQSGLSQSALGRLDQEKMRLAKELLAADLMAQPDLEPIARKCGMPVGRFIRLFRQATGLPPHRWLRAFRVQRAKELMIGSTLSLAQIAYECGFADQSHFTRVFAAAVNETPAAWRRAHGG